ncbi:MAG: DUF4032 domain-containing protein [Rhizobacter sp.]|nr:DUF4032 domain-containing protein [Chlorobiales bacterium]
MKIRIRQEIEKEYLPAIATLPFEDNLSEWHQREVQTLIMRRGDSRHPVIFVRSSSGNYRFAIKETTPALAYREVKNYERLLELGIDTLHPAGVVVREEEDVPVETAAGVMYEKNEVAFLITLLEDAVLPQSTLFSLGLQQQAKYEIFDAIAELFAKCHSKNIYWGDASLQNVLIKFKKEEFSLAKRRKLVAMLADAETLEIRSSLSPQHKQADLDFFFESMMWLDEEFRHRGIARDRTITEEDFKYLRDRYDATTKIYDAQKQFDLAANFNSERHFGRFAKASYAKVLLRQLEEHKWYLSEQKHREVPIREATLDWYVHIFQPIRDELKHSRYAEHFGTKKEIDVYLELMEHKYFLSQNKGKDVGLRVAMNDYCKRFGVEKEYVPVLMKMFQGLIGLTKEYAHLASPE